MKTEDTLDNVIDCYELYRNDNNETVILKCIGTIFDLEEKINGLNREQVIYKYTHGMCGFLAQAIRIVLKQCGKSGVRQEHFNISASHDMLTIGSGITGDKIYFDICGKFDKSNIEEHLSGLDKEEKYPEVDRNDETCIGEMFKKLHLDGQLLFSEQEHEGL